MRFYCFILFAAALTSGSRAGAQPVGDPCFDADSIYRHNIPVYIRVNFHVFMDSTGSESVYQLKCGQREALPVVEQIVHTSNRLMAANPEQWPRHDPPVLVNNPIRYVLSGVYFHHTKEANLWNLGNLHRQFAVHPDTEINFYVADLPGNSSGLAHQIGGTFAGTETTFESVFNHEIGHLLGLKHVNGPPPYDDGCPDTQPFLHEWDANCDSVIQPSERNRLCWMLIESFTDLNKNGVHDCDEQSPCRPNPCCQWSAQNNNYMLSTGGYEECFTKCQMDIMLRHLSTQKCQYLAAVGGAPPPKAVIVSPVKDTHTAAHVPRYLMLSASFNDKSHALMIRQYAPSGWRTVHATGWMEGAARDFMYYIQPNEQKAPVLPPGYTYEAILEVENEAGVSDRTTFIFEVK